MAWIYQSQGGIGTSETNLFGVHALFMSLGAVIFAQESLLSFSFPVIPRSIVPGYVLHIIFNALNICSLIGGLLGIVYYKQLAVPEPGMEMNGNQYFPYYTAYSPHSWLGIVFLSLLLIQVVSRLIGGAVGAGKESGGLANDLHIFLGRGVYLMGLACCALGFQDMQTSDLSASTPPMAPMINATSSSSSEEGYYPESSLAQYASACVLLLTLSALVNFSALSFQGKCARH